MPKPYTIKQAKAHEYNQGLLANLAQTYIHHAAFAKAKKKLKAIQKQQHAEKVSRGV